MTAVEAGVGWSFLEREPERNKRAEKGMKRITRGKGKGRITFRISEKKVMAVMISA